MNIILSADVDKTLQMRTRTCERGKDLADEHKGLVFAAADATVFIEGGFYRQLLTVGCKL
jgi:hypothetical protein